MQISLLAYFLPHGRRCQATHLYKNAAFIILVLWDSQTLVPTFLLFTFVHFFNKFKKPFELYSVFAYEPPRRGVLFGKISRHRSLDIDSVIKKEKNKKIIKKGNQQLFNCWKKERKA